MHDRIRAALSPISLALPPFTHAEYLIGTAGTVTTLAAMDMKMESYDEQRINGYTLTGQAVEKLYEAMLGLPAAQRSRMPGLEPGRAAVIPAGAAIVVEVLAATGLAELRVSDAGLLEGILLTKL
jgi:exopolyphosphatase/guanosine-5'-triphosphate,3'-diphosphate pyrophosphatase